MRKIFQKEREAMGSSIRSAGTLEESPAGLDRKKKEERERIAKSVASMDSTGCKDGECTLIPTTSTAYRAAAETGR